jgi:signal transduction histidine kinase
MTQMEHDDMLADVRKKIEDLRSGKTEEEQTSLARSLIQTLLVQFNEDWHSFQRAGEEDEEWLQKADRLIDYYSHLMTDASNEVHDLLDGALVRDVWDLSGEMLKTANVFHLMGTAEEYRARGDVLADRALALSEIFGMQEALARAEASGVPPSASGEQ